MTVYVDEIRRWPTTGADRRLTKPAPAPADDPRMSVRWMVAGELLLGLYDPELDRWVWGTRRWAWPRARAARA